MGNTTLIIILFSIAACCLINAINSKGVIRLVLSFFLATSLIVVNIFITIQILSKKDIEPANFSSIKGLKSNKKSSINNLKVNNNQISDAKQKFYKIIEKGRNITDKIFSINMLDSTIEWDKLIFQSIKFRDEALLLNEEFSTIKVPTTAPGLTKAYKILKSAVKNLTVSTNYFYLFFKAEDKNEESERYEIYKRNIIEAEKNFSKAKNELK